MQKIAISWSKWMPLEGGWKGETAPRQPGLYRIRRHAVDGLDYVGQTGQGTMTLRKRLAMLRGVYGPVMPYGGPHTAAPALWAIREGDPSPFEGSVAVVEGSSP